MFSNPIVSVIYPVYNDRPKFIHESMSSILSQDYESFEVIIVDDSNDSETIEAIDSYASDHRIVILRDRGSSGLPDALNRALVVAKGRYIARADADDVLVPGRISSQVNFLNKSPDIGIVGGNVNYIDATGLVIRTKTYPETDKSIQRHLHLRNPLCHSVVMIRRSVFDQIGTYNTSYKRAEDYELWLRASSQGVKIHNLQRVLLNYRMATGDKRDALNWKLNLKLKKDHFSYTYFFESLIGILSVYLYALTPVSVQNFIYKKLA